LITEEGVHGHVQKIVAISISIAVVVLWWSVAPLRRRAHPAASARPDAAGRSTVIFRLTQQQNARASSQGCVGVAARIQAFGFTSVV
jgi:hypothetical protein